MCLAVFLIVAFFTVTESAAPVNEAIAGFIQSSENPGLTTFIRVFSYSGLWYIFLPIAALLVLYRRTRRKIGIPAFCTVGVSALLNLLLKQLFGIPRPDAHAIAAETGYGFPSGHAMNSTALVGICVILFWRSHYPRYAKITVGIIALMFLLTMGFSRIYLGVHSPGDVLAGYAAGVCVFSITLLVLFRRAEINAPK